jgi:hypothetical protein
MAVTKIILKKDIRFKDNIIHLNIGAISDEKKKKKIALDYVCLQLYVDKNNTFIDIQETVNAIKICLQIFLISKI